MIMKIDAIVREEKFEDVKNALMDIEVNGLTVSQVMGCGLQRGYKEIVRGMEVEPQMQPKIKFEIDDSLLANSLESRIANFKNRISNKQVDVVEYVNSSSRVTLRCQICGKTYSKSYNTMLRKSECPYCNLSVTPNNVR